jgi:hypothetical protein
VEKDVCKLIMSELLRREGVRGEVYIYIDLSLLAQHHAYVSCNDNGNKLCCSILYCNLSLLVGLKIIP